MGLNESFSQVRRQIMLSDPLPPINKVFALIAQEENQRKISAHINAGSDLTGASTFAFKDDNRKSTSTSEITKNHQSSKLS